MHRFETPQEVLDELENYCYPLRGRICFSEGGHLPTAEESAEQHKIQSVLEPIIRYLKPRIIE